MKAEEIQKLTERLYDDVENIKSMKLSMEDRSWKYEEGVLISGNEAKWLLEQIMNKAVGNLCDNLLKSTKEETK